MVLETESTNSKIHATYCKDSSGYITLALASCERESIMAGKGGTSNDLNLGLTWWRPYLLTSLHWELIFHHLNSKELNHTQSIEVCNLTPDALKSSKTLELSCLQSWSKDWLKPYSCFLIQFPDVSQMALVCVWGGCHWFLIFSDFVPKVQIFKLLSRWC